ncbi:MAG: DUF2974 domain-containing protein [Clostridia bacterium]|nr:DUF2974 domain-containing protein [Clostridia bacterium]
MANINDYLLWRGDISLSSEHNFNEVDSVILARFSYLRFDKIKMSEVETIESISEKMKNLDNEEFRYNGDKELITYLGKSKRFKDMKVTDYVENNERSLEQQFEAVTIHISDEEMYISYIGTDSSIYGWKEDFNISFMDSVPCQIEGKKYINLIANKYPKKRIRIGGHSKGGNVAIYSAISAKKAIQDRIIKVCNYDGPGFNKDIIKKYKTSSILKKIETFFPQDSVIGRIMYHAEKCTVALSNEKGIYQHDIYSWQVFKDDLVKADNVTANSEIINMTLNDWLEHTTVEQREIFFDEIFDLFYATEANTFGEMSKSLSKNIMTILKKYRGIEENDRKTITSMIKLFVKAYFQVVRDKEKINFSNSVDYKKIENEARNKHMISINLGAN